MAHYALSKAPSTPTPHTNTLQDVSGTLSIIVEAIMVVVNIFPIVVALRTKRQKDRLVTDELIIALSVTDILSVVVPTPFGLVSYFNKTWYGGKPTCEFYQLTMLWFQIVSILIITYMCIDRLLALRMALYYKVNALNVVERVKYFILAIYIFALLIAALPLIGLAPPAMSTSGLLCESWITSMPKSGEQSVFYITVLVLGYGNLLVVLVVNTRVTSMMWKLQRKLQPLANRRQTNVIQLQTDRKAIVEFTWMIITVSILFYLTWFPTMLMLTVQKAGSKVSDIAVLYALLSSTLTGLLNPLIYGLFSKSYRRGYRHILTATFRFFCRCKKKEFQPIPAIACDRAPGHDPEDFINQPVDIDCELKRSRSLHDRPFGFGFYNYGFQTSLYSALTDYQVSGRSKSRTSINMDAKGCKRRARSLTPPPLTHSTSEPVINVHIEDQETLSSRSSAGSSQISNSSHNSEADLEYEDDTEEEHDDLSMQETRI